MTWFKTKVKFDEQEIAIKGLIESLLSTYDTIIEIDFENATFQLYNNKRGCSFYIDSIGIKLDVKNETKTMALDQKMAEQNLTFFKNIISKEATKRRIEKHNNTFLNRINMLEEVKNLIENDK